MYEGGVYSCKSRDSVMRPTLSSNILGLVLSFVVEFASNNNISRLSSHRIELNAADNQKGITDVLSDVTFSS